MTNKTYYGKTADQILRTARIVMMQSGLKEIVVDLPRNKQGHAYMGERALRGGGFVRDVLCVRNFDGLVCRLHTSTAAYNKLQELEAQCDMLAETLSEDI